MFTGIVEEIGEVRSVQRRRGYQRTDVQARLVLEDLRVGDSVSLNGACHTVVDSDVGGFSVDSVEETLRRTTVSEWAAGTRVNLERSLQVSSRLGGHLVAGHVDGTGRIVERHDSADAAVFHIALPAELCPYVAAKGSIAVDGISLTVVSVAEQSFSLSVIPHTLGATTLGQRRPGHLVNLEVDMVARYLERLASSGRLSAEGSLSSASLKAMGY